MRREGGRGKVETGRLKGDVSKAVSNSNNSITRVSKFFAL